MLAEPAVLFCCCRFDLPFSLFCRLISEVALTIVTKLCHMFDDDTKLGQKLGGPLLKNCNSFRQLSDMIANIFETQRDIYMYKRRKIGPELRLAQRAAITLGFATHSSFFTLSLCQY